MHVSKTINSVWRRYLWIGLLLGTVLPLSGQDKESPYEKFNRHFFSGVYHYIRAEHDRAAEHLNQAARLNDSVAAVYYYLALTQKALHHDDQARAYLDKACRLDPARQDLFRKAFAGAGQPASSQKEADKKPSPMPAAGGGLEKFLAGYKQMDDAQVWEQGRQLIALYPFHVELIWITARAGYRTGHAPEAAALLENGMDFARTSPEWYRRYLQLLIDIYQQTGQTDKADRYRQLLKKAH